MCMYILISTRFLFHTQQCLASFNYQSDQLGLDPFHLVPFHLVPSHLGPNPNLVPTPTNQTNWVWIHSTWSHPTWSLVQAQPGPSQTWSNPNLVPTPTWVRACPSFSCGPRSVMVELSRSDAGTSTHTPVECRISCRTRPRGPTMYLCWLLLTSTLIFCIVRFYTHTHTHTHTCKELLNGAFLGKMN